MLRHIQKLQKNESDKNLKADLFLKRHDERCLSLAKERKEVHIRGDNE